MIALDTNVLVRYLVQDHPQQSSKASRLIEQIESKKESCFLSDVVLCELVWVLETSYDRLRKEVGDILNQFLHIEIFRFANKEIIQEAVNLYSNGTADFADYLIGVKAVQEGAETVYTFDKGLKNASYFTLL